MRDIVNRELASLSRLYSVSVYNQGGPDANGFDHSDGWSFDMLADLPIMRIPC